MTPPMTDYGWNGDYPTDGILARVIKDFQHIYHIITDTGQHTATVTGHFRHTAKSRADYPVVGDWVMVERQPKNDRYWIHRIISRHNQLSRQHKHYNQEEQVIVSNVDIAFIVIASDGYRQDNINRLNRFIKLVTNGGIATPIIILNKIDLLDDASQTISQIQETLSPYPVISAQANEGIGIDTIQAHIPSQKTAIVLGMSGVGKSTIINHLLPTATQAVQDVRETDHKGMHTTRNRALFLLPNGGMIIDSPGIKSLEVWESDADTPPNAAAFEPIYTLASQCKFANCKHTHEPQCAVKQAVESEELESNLYQQYLSHLD